jgi:endonuclease III
MGYVPHNQTPEQVIYKARELYPEYPGVIDISCWEIGRDFCHPTKPECEKCIVSKGCKKVM